MAGFTRRFYTVRYKLTAVRAVLVVAIFAGGFFNDKVWFYIKVGAVATATGRGQMGACKFERRSFVVQLETEGGRIPGLFPMALLARSRAPVLVKNPSW